MFGLKRIDRAAIAATTVVAAVMLPATATAAPGGQGKSQGQPQGPPPHAGSGKPHAPGQKGKPHQQGQRGNPHRGSPPYGRALGYQGSAGQQGSVAAGTASAPDSQGASSRSHGGGQGDHGKGNPDRPLGKSTICHRTNSETNPFRKITVSNASLEAHAKHGDVEPAPDGSCRADSPPLDPDSPPGVEEPGGGAGGGGPGDLSEVLGEESPQGQPEAASLAQEPARGSLPVTGFAAIALACMGIVLLALGFVARALNGDPRRAGS